MVDIIEIGITYQQDIKDCGDHIVYSSQCTLCDRLSGAGVSLNMWAVYLQSTSEKQTVHMYSMLKHFFCINKPAAQATGADSSRCNYILVTGYT